MSKLGFHRYPVGSATGLGDALKKCSDAGSPVPVCFALDNNVWPTIQANSPSTIVIFRTQLGGDPNPSNIYQDDPVATANEWYDFRKPTWLINQANYYAAINEPDPQTLEQYDWLNAFELQLMKRADADGLKLAIGAHSTGTPSDELAGQSFPREQKWARLLLSLQYAKAHGHILIKHEYGFDTTLQSSTPNHALRYRRDYEYLRANNAGPMLVITEASEYNGYAGEGTSWLIDAEWYDSEIMKDSWVIGCCLYQLGGAENWFSLISRWADYVSTHPTPPSFTPSPDGTTIPPSSRIVDSVSHIWTFGAPSAHGYQLLRDGGQFAGGQGVLLLFYGGKIYAMNDDAMWFVATDIAWQSVSGDPRQKAEGIDVSHWQNNIYWPSVRNSGKTFAFIKATESKDIVDSQFRNNWNNAKRAGIIRGAYHFYRFGVEPQLQANNLLSAIASATSIFDEKAYTLPIVVDVEDTSVASPNINELKRFLDIIEAKTGRKCLVYTASWYWNNARWGGPVSWAKNRDLWVASYSTSTQPSLPSDWSSVGWKFWQYSNKGVVNGISGAVDLDRFNGTYAELKEYTHHSPPAPPPPPPPSTVTWFGVGHGTQNEIPQQHIDQYGRAFGADPHPSFKILTLPDSSEMSTSIARIKAKTPNALIMARIFFSVGDTPFTPQQFVDYSHNGTSAAYASGVRDFEVFNEPNIEGMNLNWHNGYEFGLWLKETINILRAHYPAARWWWPGLSPQPISPQFLSDALTTGVNTMLYGYCFHSYWQTESGGLYNMNDESGGISWKKEWHMLSAAERTKPIFISEFSNNAPSIPANVKGGQYKRYRALLQQNGVYAATAFVLYWPSSQDGNHENFCNLNGGSTGIIEGYLSA